MKTVEELAQALKAIRGSVRVGFRRGSYACAVEFPGGSATFSHADLGAVLTVALNFSSAHTPQPEIIGEESAPPPRRVTNVGHTVPGHCAVCGWGEQETDRYDPVQPCTNCGGTQVCAAPNGHEGNHSSV